MATVKTNCRTYKVGTHDVVINFHKMGCNGFIIGLNLKVALHYPPGSLHCNKAYMCCTCF